MKHSKPGDEKQFSSDEIGEQSSGKDADEIQREILRKGRNDEAADNRDIAGGVASDETAHGREETKNDVKGKANTNG